MTTRVEEAVERLIEWARMYEASLRLSGKDSEWARTKLKEAKATLLAALPTDDDDVERVARAIYTALGHEESLPWDRAVQVRQNHGWEGTYSRIQFKCIEAARAAIHTLIGRDE